VVPNGNWIMEVNYLKSIAVDWKVKMAASQLSPTDALFSLKNLVLQKWNYPLVTTTLSKQQCHQIMSPILQQGLPKQAWFTISLAH